ncbi:UvrD-helicase domain-containing protein [Phorcysia thermohydrogeniphila]|uniref:DNA 3'-5' helicase n=1 Tax=Phorcysia thermohydrogeniphila TaxID=936138 RepID=A0A4R1G9K2_9BACT|nr:ATP-dependent helicase [Phorcysia thermohydrogeniphila]TCK04584.1 DNA helicase-2/ATP-dependent DNA helicase PcrA [Phorcysia thermohydrogeniphila]
MLLGDERFFELVEEIGGKRLNNEQKEAITYTDGPLKVVAGPGSGKTEVIVLRALYLIAVKGVNPRSIFLVTFTKKASEEFFSRFVTYAGALKEKVKELSFEPYDIYAGTLHSLALKVMEEFQFSRFERYRLLEDFERDIILFKEFQDLKEGSKYRYFFDFFQLEREGITQEELYLQKLDVLSRLFEFIPQNLVDWRRLRGKKGTLGEAVELYVRYRKLLKNEKRLDYVHAEELFLRFLESEEGKRFLNGDGSEFFPGIDWVMVDEYQDTNPLDEEIYFALASRSKNITVVGDDNQALYRFRGAVVDCFIDFEKKCKERFGTEVKVVNLSKNYRSDREIVAFINYFITKHLKVNNEIRRGWERLSVKNKEKIKFASGIKSHEFLGDSVVEIKAGSNEELARKCCFFVKELKRKGVIKNYSDVVLLLPSTREFSKAGEKLAGYIKEVFTREGIPVYNPRSKALVMQKEVATVIGALCEIFPSEEFQEVIDEKVKFWKGTFNSEASPKLKEHVRNWKEKVESSKEESFNVMEIFYSLLQFEPLKSFKEELLTSLNLAKFSQLLSLFSQRVGEIPVENGKVKKEWLSEFYGTFLYLLSVKDADLKEVESVPEDMFPIMTFHQSKGLEFPIVIVGDLTEHRGDFKLGRLERLFGRDLSWERNTIDAVRKFYVAYSRAKYCLLILRKPEEETPEEGKPWKLAALPGFEREWHEEFSRKFREKLRERERGGH